MIATPHGSINGTPYLQELDIVDKLYDAYNGVKARLVLEDSKDVIAKMQENRKYLQEQYSVPHLQEQYSVPHLQNQMSVAQAA